MVTVRVVYGLILLAAGLVRVEPPLTLNHHGWALIGSDAGAARCEAQFVLCAADHELKTEDPLRLRPEPRPVAAIAPRLLRTTRQDRIVDSLFASVPSAPRHSGGSFAGDGPILHRTPAVGARDPRQALLDMAVAQRTGHWVIACPCPIRQIAFPVEPYDVPASGPR